MRRTRRQSQQLKALHVVSAWAGQTGITLGQVAVDAKSNEITAMPQLLKLLDLQEKIVTTDAMRASLEVKDYAGASRRRSELEVVGIPKEMKPELAVLRGRLAEARTTIDARLFSEIERRIARRGKYQRGRAANVLGFHVRPPLTGEWGSHPPISGDSEPTQP